MLEAVVDSADEVQFLSVVIKFLSTLESAVHEEAGFLL